MSGYLRVADVADELGVSPVNPELLGSNSWGDLLWGDHAPRPGTRLGAWAGALYLVR